jgi:hypothetical protein
MEIMKKNGLMFTLYGGKKGVKLTNGLAMQFYGQGWALAPDASAYESYWSSGCRVPLRELLVAILLPVDTKRGRSSTRWIQL